VRIAFSRCVSCLLPAVYVRELRVATLKSRELPQSVQIVAATCQLAQTTLRSLLGQHEPDATLSEREKLNAIIQRILDEQTEAWEIKVSNVELKRVDLNANMMRAIAQQAEAERGRRARVIQAEVSFRRPSNFSTPHRVLQRRPRPCNCAT
jgi:regulator of protease activity HflC (stomatin/prohibitin superfamily)